MRHLKVSVGHHAFPEEDEIEVDRARGPAASIPLPPKRRFDREQFRQQRAGVALSTTREPALRYRGWSGGPTGGVS